jgi:hypothetical protein
MHVALRRSVALLKYHTCHLCDAACVSRCLLFIELTGCHSRRLEDLDRFEPSYTTGPGVKQGQVTGWLMIKGWQCMDVYKSVKGIPPQRFSKDDLDSWLGAGKAGHLERRCMTVKQ